MFNNIRTELAATIEKYTERAMNNYERYLTTREFQLVSSGQKPLERYAAKIAKKVQNSYDRQFERLAAAEACEDVIVSIVINVDWIKSRTWGLCPIAEMTVKYSDKIESYVSSRASGCGYNKESTTTADVFNQCHALLKMVCAAKDAGIDLGYGTNGIVPVFSDGAGFNCHRNILEKLGFTLSHHSSGKTFDSYHFVYGRPLYVQSNH